jgi:D-lactate dehydrogenase (cytochrome)
VTSTPVIPFGGLVAGRPLAGGAGRISIDVSRMNRVLAINADDLTVTVQPGVTRNSSMKDCALACFPD